MIIVTRETLSNRRCNYIIAILKSYVLNLRCSKNIDNFFIHYLKIYI